MPEPETTLPPAEVNDSAAALLAVVDAYLVDLQAGKAPDRAAVLAAHPELGPQLESCLSALDFIHRAERTDSALPLPVAGDRVPRCRVQAPRLDRAPPLPQMACLYYDVVFSKRHFQFVDFGPKS